MSLLRLKARGFTHPEAHVLITQTLSFVFDVGQGSRVQGDWRIFATGPFAATWRHSLDLCQGRLELDVVE